MTRPPMIDRPILWGYMRRIYRILNAGDWRFRYALINGDKRFCERHGINGDSIGYLDEETMTIYIDFRFDVIATLVHECLHVIHPAWPEAAVKALEVALMARVSPTQARRLHALLAAALE